MTNPLVEALQAIEKIAYQSRNHELVSLCLDARKALSDFESQPSELCGEFTPSQLERLKRFFESQPSGWISCKDRLPDDEKYLVAYKDGSVSYHIGGIDPDDEWISHWMPLPPAPENTG